MKHALLRFLPLSFLGAVPFACAGPAPAELAILLEREESIGGGLEPGEDVENIRDGWSVKFEEFVVALGPVTLSREKKTITEGKDGLLVDLVKFEGDEERWLSFGDLEAARYDFSFSLTSAKNAAEVRSVAEETAELMKNEGFSTYVRGVLEKSDGKSCPPPKLATTSAASTSENAAGVPCYDNPAISFVAALGKATTLGPCELDGMPGVGLAAGVEKSVAVTFHGDHLFFNGFPEGDEATVVRLAQWLADSDLDVDGEVTLEELEAIAPGDLSEIDDRYSLSNAPLPIETMRDYAENQLLTQGHFQGEGECPLAQLGE